MAEIRKILVDLFDAFSITAGGNYVSLYDIKGKMTRYSPAAVELFGLPGEYIPDGAFNWSEYVHPEDRNRYESVMGELLTSGTRTYNLTYRVRLKAGGYGLFRFIGAVLRVSDDNPELVGGIMINQGLMKYTDPITVLRNQYGFFSDLSAVIERKQKKMVMLLGISRMSEINEMYGYGFGNHVLQQVGWVLQECVGADGIVYRMDGPKFAVLSEQLSAEKAEAVYRKTRQRLLGGIMVGEVKQTLILSGGMISAGDAKMNEQTIYSCLKYAYKESKEKQHGELVSFDEGGKDADLRSLEMIDAIRDCIVRDCGGFSLSYQPVFNSETEKPIGVEALLRWHSDEFGDIAPAEYVTVLERDFVFEELGYWILRQAMADGVRFVKKNPDFIVGVNIASVQIEDEFFIEEVQEIAEEIGFPLRNLCLELTKDCRQLKVKLLKDTVSALQEKGVRFIIDDFGSGVGSIDFLRELSSDYIKFDMKYIRDIETNEEDQQIISHMSELAKACGTNVCVKGIKTEGIRNVVRQYAVRSVQGFYYAMPLRADEIMEKWIS